MTSELALTYIFWGIAVIVGLFWLVIYIMDRRAARRAEHPVVHSR